MVIGEDYVLPGGRTWDTRINPIRIAQCEPDEVLVIEAWDQD